jgi:ankyrin repeat protein
LDKYEKEGESWPLTKSIYQILDLLIQKRPGQVKKLINEHAQGKNTPLHLACNHKGQELIKILLKHGADGSLFYANKEGEIPANLMLTETLRYHLDEKLASEGM